MSKAEAFIKEFQTWSQAQTDIHGAFLIGSHGQQKAHPLSDLDIAFVTSRVATYADSKNWLNRFGTVWSAIYDPEESIAGLPTSASLFTAFADGFSVDFLIMPALKTKLWFTLIQNNWLRKTFWAKEAAQSAYLFQQGVIPLFDKNGLVQQMENTKHLPIWTEAFPSEKEFAFLQDDFYLTLVQMRRLLLKGQVYAALSLRDKAIRRVLLQLLRWQAQMRDNEWGNPLRYRDKLLEHWADEVFVEALPIIFGAYGKETLWQGILKAGQIYTQLSQQLATQFGFKLDERSKAVLAWLEAEYHER